MSLSDDILNMITQRQGYVYTSIPARVLSYDQKKQTITAEIVVKRPFATTVSDNPIRLRQIPVGFYYGHDWVIASPLKKDDTVLLIFPMFDITNWQVGDKETTYDPDGYRFHNTDGAFALPVTFSFNKPTVDPRFTDRFHIVKDRNYITMAEDGIDIVSGDTQVLIDQDGDVTVNTTHCTINADTTINGHLDVRETISARGESGGSGAVCTITGDVDIEDGNLDVDGTITDNNTNLTTHIHNDSEGGNTGTPI